MKNSLNIILTSTLIFLISNCTPPAKDEAGFTVSGSKLLDAKGNEFVIRGVNSPFIWYLDGPIKSLDTLAGLNINCMRIVWETRGTVDSLEMAIKRCIELDIIPMVELHDATGDTTSEKLMEMVTYYIREDVKNMLKKYEKYLLLNIANEWGDHSVKGEFWRNSYQQAIDSLRAAGYQYTIVIDAPGWGQNLEPILNHGNELLDYDPKQNLLFSIHMYGSWNDSTKIAKKLQEAKDANLPLIVGEFGYNYNNGQNNLGAKVNHKTILRVCEELGYGYLAWSWTGNNEENAWLDLAKLEDWQTLTWWGKEVFYGPNGIVPTATKASIFTE